MDEDADVGMVKPLAGDQPLQGDEQSTPVAELFGSEPETRATNTQIAAQIHRDDAADSENEPLVLLLIFAGVFISVGFVIQSWLRWNSANTTSLSTVNNK
jgi:hypothetical protein